MSKSRLFSGKVKKVTGSELDLNRNLFLDLANAEPDLGVPAVDGSLLVADTNGTRYWSPSIRADVTGNIFLGSINSADGSTAIRLTNSTIIEGDLTIDDGVGNIPSLITSDIRSLDSSSIVIANSIIAQADLEVQNDLTVNGNFTVLGSTTTINSTTLTIEDKNIELAKNSTSAATSDGAGITVVGPTIPAIIAYNADTDTWNFNKTIVGTVQGATGQGDIGYTGSKGDTGFTGSQGLIGYTGSAGTGGAGGVPRFLSLIQEGNLRVLNGISRWYAPASVTITKIIARVDEAPTGNNVLLRINKVASGVTTSINMTITATTTKTENNSPNLSLAADDYLTVDVTQIGGTNPGKGLRVTFIYE